MMISFCSTGWTQEAADFVKVLIEHWSVLLRIGIMIYGNRDIAQSRERDRETETERKREN
jgi:hypothetical protein